VAQITLDRTPRAAIEAPPIVMIASRLPSGALQDEVAILTVRHQRA